MLSTSVQLPRQPEFVEDTYKTLSGITEDLYIGYNQRGYKPGRTQTGPETQRWEDILNHLSLYSGSVF